MNVLCFIGFHEWNTTPSEYRDSTEEDLGIQAVVATRTCSRCGKKQELDIHCLGLNPPSYTKTWRTI